MPVNTYNRLKDCEELTSFGEGQIHRNTSRHADFVQLEVGVTCNDCSSGKIDSFSHKVPTETPLFALETCADGLNRTTRLLQSLWNASNVVVHVRRDVELVNGQN